MKKFLIQIFGLGLIAVLALSYQTGQLNLPFFPTPPGLYKVPDEPLDMNRVIIGGDVTVYAEIADTPEARSKGLGGQDPLASNSGMLFVFEEDGEHTFWMKGMKFPLDFIWIRDNKVVDLTLDVPNPSPNTPDEELSLIQSNQPTDQVLEVIGGYVAANGIQIGDSIEIRRR